jgi:hypothetical protein
VSHLTETKLFIGSIHDMVTESMLMEFFASFCKVRSVKFALNSRGCAFLELVDDLDVTRALQADGHEFYGRALAVRRPNSMRGWTRT